MQVNETIPPALMSTKEACQYLAISERTLYDLVVNKGRITAVVIGPRLKRYERDELDKFVRECRGGGQ